MYINLDGPRQRKFIKWKSEQGDTELKGRHFRFLRLSFSILQPRRQARCTCPQPWGHPFQDSLRLQSWSLHLPQKPNFPVSQTEQEKALQATCFDRGQHTRTSSNAISSLRKRTEKARLYLPRLSRSRKQWRHSHGKRGLLHVGARPPGQELLLAAIWIDALTCREGYRACQAACPAAHRLRGCKRMRKKQKTRWLGRGSYGQGRWTFSGLCWKWEIQAWHPLSGHQSHWKSVARW